MQAGFKSKLITAAGSIAQSCWEPAGVFAAKQILKPHLHALKNQHGTPNVWHRADDFKAWHSQFSTCKRIGPKCNVLAPVLKILWVLRLPSEGSLSTGKLGTVPKI